MAIKMVIPASDFREVSAHLKQSGVKFYPFRSYGSVYHIQFEPADHPLVSFLLLKYDGARIIS